MSSVYDPSPRQPRGRGHDVERPGLSGLDATFESDQWGGNGADGIGFVLAAENPRTRRRQRSSDSRGCPRLRLGHAAGTQGSPTGTSGWVSTSTELFEPRRGRLGLYRPLMGHGQNPVRSSSGPGQRGRRLLPPEQLGRGRRSRSSWSMGRVRGARRSRHQHPSGPVNMTATGFTGVSVPMGITEWPGRRSRLSGGLHRRAPTVANGGIPVRRVTCTQRLGQPFHRRPLSVRLRLGRVDRRRRRRPRDLERRRQHPAAGARADSSIGDSENGQLRSPAGRLHGHGRRRHRRQRERPHQHDHDAAEWGHRARQRDRLVVCDRRAGVTCTYTASVAAGTTLPRVTLPATVAATASTGPARSAPRSPSRRTRHLGDRDRRGNWARIPATLQQVTLSASVPSAAAGIGTIGSTTTAACRRRRSRCRPPARARPG